MQSCSIHHCVLFFLTLTFTTVPALAFTSVTVKLHQSATLPCNSRCSGFVKWTMFHNPDYILAQCDQTACRSEKGYEVSHDQYLQGKPHLTITAVDYSKRALYTCQCDGVEVCDVRLVIDTLMSSVQLNPGEALVMDLPVPEPVEVIYKPIDSAGLYGEQICTVTQRSLQCKTEYTRRASLSYPNITLRDVNMSDSGSYTIRDRKNDEVIHIYTLIVKVVQPESEGKLVSHWVHGVIVGILLLILMIVGAGFVLKNWHVKRLKKEKADLEETIKLNESVTEGDNHRQRANSDAEAAQLIKQMLKVDTLIQQYKTESVRTSQSWTSLNDIPVVELLKRKKAELDEILQGREISEQDTIGQWWSLKRPELDAIIEHWKKYDAEPDQIIQVEQCSSAQELCNQ
ncbi:hypothetical protein PHYPO_G00137780 [Pangasianodon hypophthalmus]|uniref:Immunoglobulin domain-containing protein n=1 Tax=Pangasianodon hypophthalmus TaxID=310915 RepID=A0A5N5KBR2_PANHP|nr:hypothetical protein PHYPO_G00137780 [Pangasianodon hypophthalmus]